MVAAIANNYLLGSAQNNAYGVAYVYCNYKSQADQDTASILAAILKQLVQGRPPALGPVERLHHKHASRGTRPSLDDTFSALRDVVCSLLPSCPRYAKSLSSITWFGIWPCCCASVLVSEFLDCAQDLIDNVS
jgi:hypothetical protein